MAGTRKIAAILVADIVGYSRLAGADEERTLSRLRGLRSDLIDPAIDAHHGRIVKRTGDGSLIEFRSGGALYFGGRRAQGGQSLAHYRSIDRGPGRRGLPAESALRCGLLKQHRQLSYEELAFHLENSSSFRAFARLPLSWTPKNVVAVSHLRPVSDVALFLELFNGRFFSFGS